MAKEQGGMRQTTSSGPAAPKDRSDALPSLRFYYSESLRSKVLAIIESIESADDPSVHREALAAVVVELTETGLDYYFVGPVKAAEVGFMAERSTKLGISSILKVMAPVIRRIIGGMDSHQLRVVTGHIRHLMH